MAETNRRFIDDNEIEEEVKIIIDNLFLKFNNIIQNKWLASIEVPIAAEVAVAKIKGIVSWAVLEHDGKVVLRQTLEEKLPDREPTPVSIDPWARGAVPTRKINATEPDDMYQFQTLAHGGPGSDYARSVAGSVRSSKTSGSGRSKSSAGTSYSSNARSRRGSFGKSVPNKGLMETTNFAEIEDDDARSATSDRFSLGHMFELMQKSSKQKNGEEKVDLVDEFELIQQEIDRATKELKGKRFTLDVDGKPVPVVPVAPSNLPPFAYQLGLNITSGPQTNKPTKDKDPNIKKKKVRVRVAGSRDVEESFFVASASLSSSIDGQNIVLNPGVTIRTNDAVREGPPPPEDPKKPSRKNFFKNRTSAMTTASSLGAYDSPLTDTKSAFGDSKDMSIFSSTMPELSAATPSSVLLRTGNRFVDVDATEGGRKVVIQPAVIIDPTDSELGLGPVVMSGKPQPAKLPAKANPTQKLFGKADLSGPRDREPPRAQKAQIEKLKHSRPVAHVEGNASLSAEPTLGNSANSVVSKQSIDMSKMSTAGSAGGKVQADNSLLKQIF